jgi:N6-L-threonylcarbamoyladenine synthase
VHSQAALHSPYGGVFPTLAKREHEKNLVPLLAQILIQWKNTPTKTDRTLIQKEAYEQHISAFKQEYAGQNADLVESFAGALFLAEKPPIDAIAVTEGPGLEPALWTGIVFAQMLSTLWDIPILPINHMEGHVVGSLLPSDLTNDSWQQLKPLHAPALAFLISGGHTELVKVEAHSSPTHSLPRLSYEIIGQTKDDAVGEAFDKVARLLSLPYPGGPHISKLAAEARTENILPTVKLPRPMIQSKDLNFSFSGLKTAVLYAVRDAEKISSPSGTLTDQFKKGLAREFEDSIVETLDAKLRKALDDTGAQTIIIGGGVSANTLLRERFEKTATEYGVSLYLPSSHISGDNALMIALAGAFNSDLTPRPVRAHGTKRLGA